MQKQKRRRRTQLTNMGKIPANEDGQSSGDLLRWRGEGGIMTLTLHQGSRGGRGEEGVTQQELLCDNSTYVRFHSVPEI